MHSINYNHYKELDRSIVTDLDAIVAPRSESHKRVRNMDKMWNELWCFEDVISFQSAKASELRDLRYHAA